MKRFAPFVTLLLVAVIGFSACYFSSYLWHSKSQLDGHRMLHEQLKLTTEQENQLRQIEQHFQERKVGLEARINKANLDLGQALIADKNYSDRVEAAVDTIHDAQGQLQKLTLEHLFEMQSVMTPEQSDKLNRLAADALIHTP